MRRAFQVTRCNQCDHAPCVAACPTEAMYRRPDGIVDFDKGICIGCKACVAACPYDAIFINPEDHSAEKCNFCAHRLEIGLEPACVTVCPTEAILVGDLDDPTSRVAAIIGREPVAVRRPEKETRPKLYYKGAHQATLDPLAARRPDGGLYAWSSQGDPAEAGLVASGHPGRPASSAAALVSYDVPHQAPWGWRVSLYTCTKGVAAGAMLVAVILALAGRLSWEDDLTRWSAPGLAGAFLALTGLLLIWDLTQPRRFYLLLHPPPVEILAGQRGDDHRRLRCRPGRVLAGLGGGLVGTASGDGRPGAAGWGGGRPATRLTCSPRQRLVTCGRVRCWYRTWPCRRLLAGAAAILPFAEWQSPHATVVGVEALLCGAAAAHLLAVAGEVTLAHPTSHAHLAILEMVRGRFAAYFWAGVAGVAVAVAAPWIGVVAVPFGLAGLLAHEHSYVQAGQSVPLA